MWDRAHVSSLCWLLRQDSHSASPNPGVCDEPAYHPGKVTILYVPQRPELQLCKQPELRPKGFRWNLFCFPNKSAYSSNKCACSAGSIKRNSVREALCFRKMIVKNLSFIRSYLNSKDRSDAFFQIFEKLSGNKTILNQTNKDLAVLACMFYMFSLSQTRYCHVCVT